VVADIGGKCHGPRLRRMKTRDLTSRDLTSRHYSTCINTLGISLLRCIFIELLIAISIFTLYSRVNCGYLQHCLLYQQQARLCKNYTKQIKRFRRRVTHIMRLAYQRQQTAAGSTHKWSGNPLAAVSRPSVLL